MSEHRPWGSFLLASIGVAVLLLEVALHVAGYFSGHTYELDHATLFVGVVLGFVGFYGMDPRRARDGGDFLVTAVVRIAGVIPFVRKSGAIPSASVTITPAPTPPPSSPPPPPSAHP